MNEIIVDKQCDIQEKLKEGKNLVVFKLEKAEDVIACLKKLNEYEIACIEKQTPLEVSLNFKALDLPSRECILQWALTYKDLVDSTLILNIFNLIKGFNNCDKSFFDVKEVMFNTFEEFIDVKTALKDDLLAFRKELAKYFYSLFRTVGATIFPDNVRPEIMPLIYQRIFLIADFISISNMIRNFKSVDGLVFVENAELFLQALATRYVFAGALMKQAGVMLGDNNVGDKQ